MNFRKDCGFCKPKPVIAIYPDGTTERFASINDAAKSCGLTARTIINVLKGRLKKHDPLEWYGVTFEYEAESLH